jgi:GGDEF domain-containing protein
MSLQGPILVVAAKPTGELAQALGNAGAFPVIEASWAEARAAAGEIKPSAIVTGQPGAAETNAALALARETAKATPFVPIIARVREDAASALPDALPIAEDAPVERLIARLAAALRLRALHAAVLGRARTLKAERNIVAEVPAGDPLDDATVLLVGRGRHHATLSVAVGERMGVMGALSVDAAARCLLAREVDGVVIGEGLPSGSVDLFLTVLAQDARFRDLPVAVLGGGGDADMLANIVWARDPLLLLERAVPLIRLRAFEAALKRLLKSIECKGMIDPQTGLLNVKAFGQELGRAIDDAGERGVGLSLARFSFEPEIDRRTSLDAARLVSRLVRGADFACRQDDGSVLFVFADTDLRAAHVVARRLASVLKHTMLRPRREAPEDRSSVSPAVTLATLKPTDTVLTLLARVSPRPVAAA